MIDYIHAKSGVKVTAKNRIDACKKLGITITDGRNYLVEDRVIDDA